MDISEYDAFKKKYVNLIAQLLALFSHSHI